MRISIYVPCYNAARTLSEVLDAILRQTRNADEILVIDDGSTDGTAEVASSFSRQRVRLVQQPGNRGLGAARNRALEVADGDILVGLDADVRPEEHYLQSLVEAFDVQPQLGAVCGHLTEVYQDHLADRWRAVHMAQHYGDESGDNPRILFGCTTAIRMEAARRLSGWKEQYRETYEDVDLTERLRGAGIPFRYLAHCRAFHLKRDTLPSALTNFWKWFYPVGLQQGHFDSLDDWIQRRLDSVQWGIFRYRIHQDLQQNHNELMVMTCLLPWWMTVCDLRYLFDKHIESRSLIAQMGRILADIMYDQLLRRKCGPELARWMTQQIASKLPKSMSEATGEEHKSVSDFTKQVQQTADSFLALVENCWERVLVGYRIALHEM